jgi:cation diffusion facilitator CzcD-associated flavoprotein CzcO
MTTPGFLNVPHHPTWPGLEAFEGPAFHTARWEHEHDLTRKVVAVVGTGSSATQVVPAIQPLVEKLYVFQREPGWVLPKGERDFTDDERARLGRRWPSRLERWRQRWQLERNLWGGRLNRPGTRLNTSREQTCRRYIARVTPTYPYPGKRPVVATTFFPALKEANVELVPRAVASVTPHSLVDADGVERTVDVIVLATGFEPANYLARLPVTGRGGQSLQAWWAGEPHAFLGITVPGFPNFFMLYGPGTNGGEIVVMLESQAEYAVRAVRRLIRRRATTVEVRPRFEAVWNRWPDRRIEGTSWTMTNSYFQAPSGKVVTQWPYGNLPYRLLTKLLGPISETTTR